MAEKRKSKRATTPEARENQLIALAYDRAEEKLRDGTASNQLICTILKMGSRKEALEKEKLESENVMLRAKTESLESAKEASELYSKALRKFSIYAGKSDNEEDYEPDDY